MRPTSMAVLAALALLAAALSGASEASARTISAPGTAGMARHSPGRINVDGLSSGARSWFLAPRAGRGVSVPRSARVAFGSNVDAADPNEDLAAGQSETAIAAAGSTVLTGWNDATAALVLPTTERRASLTGLGLSTNGGRTFRDLVGLRNGNSDQQWSGDPSIVAVDPRTFLIASLYLPTNSPDCSIGQQARFQLAVEVLTLGSTGAASLGLPVISADGGDLCALVGPNPPLDLAMLDKEWLSYDTTTRTLAMSYTRFFFGFGGQSGAGQIEMVRAQLPADPRALTAANWSAPITVWPEEFNTLNTGAYVSVAANGDAYLSWERNIQSNATNGNPFVYIHAARVRARDVFPAVGGSAAPRVVSLGQRNSDGAGGVKSLDTVVITGYSRGVGQDFPRIAVDEPKRKVIIVWNDASTHPLGDIWMRVLPLSLSIDAPIRRVNDDNSFALHFLPAVSIRGDGTVTTSWYDRRRAGPNSSRTNYYGESRTTAQANAPDFRITTGSTDWMNTSSYLNPNFGDYTDSASTATRTYFAWSDARIGVPQPFVDSR